MDIKILECGIDDLNLLIDLGNKTFYETYASMVSPETLEMYLKQSFSKERISEELNKTGSKFYLAYSDNELAGYLKINTVPDQTSINDPESVEIERIYIKMEFKGKGLGKQLMNYVIQSAKDSGKRYIWLGVWEKNQGAIAFYSRMGFQSTGRNSFKTGNEIHSDIIMKKNI